ncbi:hypothetical protein F4820DRAFT_451980 [Hypoxylon rubiginosum]|uniref:Uncharacterized protein n=1 Tax=Hypoxylon rubiginosum TaxID=110542 RepID=A0ACB9YPV5_9PEZI|nr:hypothetical protein F4820DRAFT_451980 [Hypoxylon rubiginosum]
MGQYWKLVNVDKSEKIPQRGAKMVEVLGFRDAKVVLSLLTVPNLKNGLAPERELRRTRVYNFYCRLVKLPQQVFDAIVAEISDPISILSLALTCSYFWRVLLPQVRAAICTIQAPWAGDRLVFVGDYASGVP